MDSDDSVTAAVSVWHVAVESGVGDDEVAASSPMLFLSTVVVSTLACADDVLDEASTLTDTSAPLNDDDDDDDGDDVSGGGRVGALSLLAAAYGIALVVDGLTVATSTSTAKRSMS